jgi:hypothetical protein
MLSKVGFAADCDTVITAAVGVIGDAMSRVVRYCAAFMSFQISVYFARRGTFCQKFNRFW